MYYNALLSDFSLPLRPQLIGWKGVWQKQILFPSPHHQNRSTKRLCKFHCPSRRLALRVVVPQQTLFVRSVTLGDWHSFLSHSRAQPSHYFRLHIFTQSSSSRFIFCVWNRFGTEQNTCTPRHKAHTQKNFILRLESSLPLASRRFYFCEQCIDLFHDTER